MANPQPDIIDLRFLSWGAWCYIDGLVGLDLGCRICRYKMPLRGCRVIFTVDIITPISLLAFLDLPHNPGNLRFVSVPWNWNDGRFGSQIQTVRFGFRENRFGSVRFLLFNIQQKAAFKAKGLADHSTVSGVSINWDPRGSFWVNSKTTWKWFSVSENRFWHSVDDCRKMKPWPRFPKSRYDWMHHASPIIQISECIL